MKIVNSKYESLRSNKKKLKRIIKYRRCDDGLKRKARGRRKARISCRTRLWFLPDQPAARTKTVRGKLWQ